MTIKRIGFIDYFLDEWHANQFPAWIDEATEGKMKVTCAYGMVDSPEGLSNAEWASKMGIELLDSIEEVVAQSDYLIVLSPDHPEYHEELSQLPLQSGKPTFIDKTFAPNRQVALRLLDLAEKHNTPMYSSSALRFATEYKEADRSGIDSIVSMGPGSYENYAVHQIEPIVSLLGPEAEQLMYIGTPHSPALIIKFAGGRQAMFHLFGWECPFGLTLNDKAGHAKVINPDSGYFAEFIRDLVRFFETGVSSVDPAETITIMTIYEYGMIAAQTPFQWIDLPS